MSQIVRCQRTMKPIDLCCTGDPWRDIIRAIDYGEPLPQLVIDLAQHHGLDPHAIMDDVEDRGWETHDKGFDEQVQIAADRLRKSAR